MSPMRIGWAPLALLLLSSCDRQDDVRRYRAPKDPSWRILGAVVPGPQATCFFKVWGASDRLGPHKAEFMRLIQSVRWEDGNLRWALPDGWTEEPGSPSRVATLRFGQNAPKFELSVTRLDGGGLVGNLNRWREQLGLPALAESELAAQLEFVEVGSSRATIVDFSGPRRPGESSRNPHAEDDGLSRESFDYAIPPGWEENPQPGPNRILEFRAGRGSCAVTLSVLRGGGGVAANVHRWRDQVGLPLLEDPAAERLAEATKFLKFDAGRVELVGKERAILCTFVLGDSFSIFLKLDGPPENVAAEKTNYRIFSDSMRMKR